MAFKGGLSFNLDDVIVPPEKEKLLGDAASEVENVMMNYNMGLITNNERYNQIIDIWTHTNSKLTFALMNRLKNDNQGFNSILYDVRFRSTWFERTNSSAFWNEGSDGQAT